MLISILIVKYFISDRNKPKNLSIIMHIYNAIKENKNDKG